MKVQGFGFNVVMKGFISYVLDMDKLGTREASVHIAWMMWK